MRIETDTMTLGEKTSLWSLQSLQHDRSLKTVGYNGIEKLDWDVWKNSCHVQVINATFAAFTAECFRPDSYRDPCRRCYISQRNSSSFYTFSSSDFTKFKPNESELLLFDFCAKVQVCQKYPPPATGSYQSCIKGKYMYTSILTLAQIFCLTMQSGGGILLLLPMATWSP